MKFEFLSSFVFLLLCLFVLPSSTSVNITWAFGLYLVRRDLERSLTEWDRNNQKKNVLMCIYPIFRVAKQTTYWTGYNREMRKSHHLLTINDNMWPSSCIKDKQHQPWAPHLGGCWTKCKVRTLLLRIICKRESKLYKLSYMRDSTICTPSLLIYINQKWGVFPFDMPWRYRICNAKCPYSCRDDLP